MKRIITDFMLLPLFCVLVAGCSSTVTEYRVGSDGRATRVGRFTEEEHWKRLVDERISKELAGEKPDGGSPTWEHYWRTWYAGIRHNPDVGFKSTDLKTTEDMVSHMKQRRIARGLPPYE